jgi:hypothetical protein
MIRNKVEIGSDFHYTPMDFNENLSWFRNALFLQSGRSPVVLLRDTFKGSPIHYPDYFCHDVIKYWNKHGVETIPYRVYYENGRVNVDFSTLPKNGIVLAVNFFGYFNQDEWIEYKNNNQILLIEDHSHSPVSLYAQNSCADFAFSSLRKTLPLADGCVFWSPVGKPLPACVLSTFDSGKKIDAMQMKSAYLSGKPISKDSFLSLYREGEDDISSSEPMLMSEYSRILIDNGYPLFYIQRRKDNYELFTSHLHEEIYSYVDILKVRTFEVPLGIVLKCNESKHRDSLRKFLIAENVFCPVHWPLCENITKYRESKDLSEKLITIPLDHRYLSAEVIKVATLINRYFTL